MLNEESVTGVTQSVRDVPLNNRRERFSFPMPQVSPRAAKVLIVDDEPYSILVIRKFLQRTGHQELLTATGVDETLDALRNELPDVVLLSSHLGGSPDGLNVLRFMAGDPVLSTIPAIVMTAAADSGIRTEASRLGAADVLNKPVEPSELLLRVRNVLAANSHFDNLTNLAAQVGLEVRRRTDELAQSRERMIFSLARAAEFRDNETGNHVIRVGRFSWLIARQLGFSEAQADTLELAAQLHDIGKIGIPTNILHKPGKLDDDEYNFMKQHCRFGQQIIEGSPVQQSPVSDFHFECGTRPEVGTSPLMEMASRVSLTHHERWDGAGYPLGLAKEEIPIEGRIVSVADVFDALSCSRAYKEAFPREKCFEILKDGRDTQFDGRVLDAFLNSTHQIIQVQNEYTDVE
ncbi:MAG: response regulator [Planctomycetes bacterium]|nr:response regulator [Planctomycetota bacterium]